jgi:hypothetical protein
MFDTIFGLLMVAFWAAIAGLVDPPRGGRHG